MPDPKQFYTDHALDVGYEVRTIDDSGDFTLIEPAGVPGGRCRSGAKGPWAAPERMGDARAILAQTRSLLELMQAAQREGELTEAGLCDLVQFERFYTALQRQIQELC